jgi:hypothetical protein
MRLQLKALAITGAAVALLAYLLGAIVNFLSPWGAVALVSYIYHVDLTNLARPFAWDSFVLGCLAVGAFGGLMGALTAWIYNAVAAGAATRVPAAQTTPG